MPRLRPRPLAVALLALLLGACGPAATRAPTPTLPPISLPPGYVDTRPYQQEPPYSVCFSNASLSNSWRVAMVEHLRYEVKRHPEIGTFRETTANDTPAQQLQDVDDLLRQGCHVLLISPAQQTLNEVIDRAMRQGVPVVLVDRSVPGDGYVARVAADNCAIGRTQAEWLVQALGGAGRIVLLSGTKGTSPAEERLRCAREVFAAAPGVEELAHAYVNWSPIEAKQVTMKWLAQYPQIDGVWSDSNQAVGAIEAFGEYHRPVPPITAADNNRFLKLWQRQGLNAVAVSFPVRMGQVAVDTALDILAGKPVPRHIDVSNTTITSDTLERYVRPDLPDDYWADSDPNVARRLFP